MKRVLREKGISEKDVKYLSDTDIEGMTPSVSIRVELKKLREKLSGSGGGNSRGGGSGGGGNRNLNALKAKQEKFNQSIYQLIVRGCLWPFLILVVLPWVLTGSIILTPFGLMLLSVEALCFPCIAFVCIWDVMVHFTNSLKAFGELQQAQIDTRV